MLHTCTFTVLSMEPLGRILNCTLCHPYGSGPDPYLEICLLVNLNFQVLTNGIFPLRECSIQGSLLLTFNDNILSLLQIFQG